MSGPANIRITQIDGTLPNLALMRLSGWHRERGDNVYFTRSVRRDMLERSYEKVYGSAIFKFSDRRVERFQTEFPDAIIGGTGSGNLNTLEPIIGDYMGLDYANYPDFKASIGFTQRGCRLSCKFCVVPTKEGKPRDESTITDIWRGKRYPRWIHLLDNDFFGAPSWRERMAEIRKGEFKVSFTQGINVRAVNEEVAAELATVEYRDGNFKRRRLYTAWDNLKDENVFFRGVDLLEAAGIPPKHLMTYMLVGFAKNETWEKIHHRFNRMVERGIRPYPMVFDNKRKDLKKFQRWAIRRLYEIIPFEEYSTNPKKVVETQETLLQ